MEELQLRDVQVKRRVRMAAEFLDPSPSTPYPKVVRTNALQVTSGREGSVFDEQTREAVLTRL